ncbi:hypothetical protein SAMN05216379_12032 [Nitrosomonas eutropha]|uniref:Uncharacterized protein n=1 Tax=Nitrosomonas eutropha TaxID=916 RepID=A0ABX5M5A3_9PROT|nr:hypothetical protein C8R14_12432 [Nitrosomonas eutropha]SCX23196.1 hypothetical protein SAMN05216379_12032 [Nitrosomonas eutropha]
MAITIVDILMDIVIIRVGLIFLWVSAWLAHSGLMAILAILAGISGFMGTLSTGGIIIPITGNLTTVPTITWTTAFTGPLILPSYTLRL